MNLINRNIMSHQYMPYFKIKSSTEPITVGNFFKRKFHINEVHTFYFALFHDEDAREALLWDEHLEGNRRRPENSQLPIKPSKSNNISNKKYKQELTLAHAYVNTARFPHVQHLKRPGWHLSSKGRANFTMTKTWVKFT